MGIDYSAEILVGFTLDAETVHKVFQVKTPGKFHMEDRFDPKTGAKLKSEKVWDEHPETRLMYKGEEYYQFEGFEELLEELIDCQVSTIGSYPCGKLEYVFHPAMPSPSNGGEDMGKVTFGPSYWYKDLLPLEPRFRRIKAALKKIELDVGEPEVKLSVTIS